MKHIRLFVLLGTFPLLISCYDREREERLTTRERNILVKEKEFAMKESEFLALQRMRDSLNSHVDSSLLFKSWPSEIEGYWNSKIVCTESSCSDYAVGDQRNDTWLFSSDSTQMVTKILNNNTLVRVYSASYANDLINLKFKTDSTASRQVAMNVLLNEISPTKLRGIRTVSVDNKCTARFNVELNRVAGQ